MTVDYRIPRTAHWVFDVILESVFWPVPFRFKNINLILRSHHSSLWNVVSWRFSIENRVMENIEAASHDWNFM